MADSMIECLNEKVSQDLAEREQAMKLQKHRPTTYIASQEPGTNCHSWRNSKGTMSVWAFRFVLMFYSRQRRHDWHA